MTLNFNEEKKKMNYLFSFRIIIRPEFAFGSVDFSTWNLEDKEIDRIERTHEKDFTLKAMVS